MASDDLEFLYVGGNYGGTYGTLLRIILTMAVKRTSMCGLYGGMAKGQKNLEKSLTWLASVQKPDGSWGSEKISKPAITGLALLTFLAHGETHMSKKYGKTVAKTIQWLVTDPITHNSGPPYAHSIKTYALAEAYTMTGLAVIEGPMLDCINAIITGQQDGGCFNYHYNKDEKRQDLSLAGWAYQAMNTAYDTGLKIKGLEEGINKAIGYLKKMGGAAHSFPYPSRHNSGGATKHTMRAAGFFCLQLFNEGKTVKITDGIKNIFTDDLAKLDWNNPPKGSLYGWYYATQCMFQAGGNHWKLWNRKFQNILNDNQHDEGYWKWTGLAHSHHVGDDITQKV